MDKVFIFALILLLIDIPMVLFVMGPRYKEIGLGLKPRTSYAIGAYLIMILAWYLIKGDPMKAALTGFCIYGVYAFTLGCVYPAYNASLLLTEVIWGTVLYTVANYLTNKLG
jgi:hypothetical protein